MTASPRTTLAIACITALLGTATAHASDTSALTIYRSDSAPLYASSNSGSVNDGYAVVREQRALKLTAGTHEVVIGDLRLRWGFPMATPRCFRSDCCWRRARMPR